MQPVTEGTSLGEAWGNPLRGETPPWVAGLGQCLWQKFPWPLEGAQSLQIAKCQLKLGTLSLPLRAGLESELEFLETRRETRSQEGRIRAGAAWLFRVSSWDELEA